MKRLRKRIPVHRPESHGVAPGTLRAQAGAHASRLSVIAYGPDRILEEADVSPARLVELRAEYPVTWVNFEGLADIDLLQQLGEIFGLHRLALEDSLNIPQRPKLDDYGDHQYLVARMPVAEEALDTEQVSLFLGAGFLLTVQEKPGDCFDGVRARLREGRTRIRERGPDYLVYAMVDAIVDAYFPLLEAAALRLDELEASVLGQPQKVHLSDLYDLKRGLIILRRYLGPLRELISALLRDENPLLADKNRVYMRDCLDHAKQAYDLVESYRDMATGLMDLYLSMMSHRMNEVMKVLTTIATIFIPLSFIVGLYGMNFDPEVSRWNMPELGLAFGYPMALGAMALVSGGMIFFFWKKGWFR